MTLFHVEPPGIPPLQRGVQWYSDVIASHPTTELQIHTTDHSGTTASLLLQPEHVSEEVEVGKKFEIRLTEMDKNGDVQDGVGMQVA